MQRTIKLDAINSYLLCTLCNGYLVDATTLVECLHSFCRSCLVKYLENSHDCPKCSMEIHKTKPFDYIRSDPCLQEIVYKLVPDLFSSEEKRKRGWKKQETIEEEVEKDDYGRQSSATSHPAVQPGTPDESRILVTLKYFRGTSRFERIKTEKVLQMFPTRYLCCNPEMPVRILKKFVCLKYDISVELFKIELWRGDETLCEELTLKQLVQIYGLFRERKPLDLHFSLYPKFEPTIVTKDPAEEEKGESPSQQAGEKVEQGTAKTEDGAKDAVLSFSGSDEIDQSVSEDNDKALIGDVIPNQEQTQREVSNLRLTSNIETNTQSVKVLKELSGDSSLQPNLLGAVDKPESMELCKDKITAITPNVEKVVTEKVASSEESKPYTSTADDSLLLKEELKKLTAKNNLNTTDSDSSQKSNVSSLDVNMLMDDDFKPELLQSEFLNLFDSDSQHISDMDMSALDHNVSIDSSAGTASKNDITSDSAQDQTSALKLEPEKCENAIEPCDQKNISPIMILSNALSSSQTSSEYNNEDSRLFIPARPADLLDVTRKTNNSESSLNPVPQLPGVSTVSKFHLDVPSNAITGKYNLKSGQLGLMSTLDKEGSNLEPTDDVLHFGSNKTHFDNTKVPSKVETHVPSSSEKVVAQHIQKNCESSMSPLVSPVKPTSNSTVDKYLEISNRDFLFNSLKSDVQNESVKSLISNDIKSNSVSLVVSSSKGDVESRISVAIGTKMSVPSISVTDYTTFDEAMKTSTPLITSSSITEDEKRPPLLSPVIDSSEHSFLKTESIFSLDLSSNSAYRTSPIYDNSRNMENTLTVEPPSQGDGGTVKLHDNLTTTSTTTTTTASSINALTVTTASVSNQNNSTSNTDKMLALLMTDKQETSFTNKKMIASLIDCRVTISNLPNLDQLPATTNNMTRHEQNTNGTSNTMSSNSSNSSTNGCMSIHDSSATSLNNVCDTTEREDEM